MPQRWLCVAVVTAASRAGPRKLVALSGRATSFLGPALLAAVTTATQSQRWGMAVVLGLLGGGAALLAGVRDQTPV